MLLSKSICNYRQLLLIKNNLKLNETGILFNRKFSTLPKNEIKIENLSDTNINVEQFYLPEPPNVSEAFESLEVINTYNHLGEATFASLGLNSYWPTGWSQAAYESMHVTFNLPWWAAIAISAFAIRIIMFPISIKIRKLSVVNKSIAPKVKELQNKIEYAKVSNNMQHTLKLLEELQNVMKTSKYNPFKSVSYPLLQIIPFISIMMGLREMANLPVASLQNGGMLWFTDLTMYDPYYILPITTMFLVLIQMEIGADLSSTSSSLYVKWALRCFPVVGVFLTCNFPSALLFYWCCSSFLSVSSVGIMKIPFFKTKFGLTEDQILQTSSGPKSLGLYKDWKRNSAEKEVLNRVKNLANADNEKWISAGTSIPPKTFSYDPTKIKASEK